MCTFFIESTVILESIFFILNNKNNPIESVLKYLKYVLNLFEFIFRSWEMLHSMSMCENKDNLY